MGQHRRPDVRSSPLHLLAIAGTAFLGFAGCYRSHLSSGPDGGEPALEDGAPPTDGRPGSVDAGPGEGPVAPFVVSVVDRVSDAPVAGARVQLDSEAGSSTLTTDEEGRASFEAGPGARQLTVVADRYAPHSVVGVDSPTWIVRLSPSTTAPYDSSVRADASASLDALPPASAGLERTVRLLVYDALGHLRFSNRGIATESDGERQPRVEVATLEGQELWGLWLGSTLPADAVLTYPLPQDSAPLASHDRMTVQRLRLEPGTTELTAPPMAAAERTLTVPALRPAAGWDELTVAPLVRLPGGPPVRVARPVLVDGEVIFQVPEMVGAFAGGDLRVRARLSRSAGPVGGWGVTQYVDFRRPSDWPADGVLPVPVQPARGFSFAGERLRVEVMDESASVHEVWLTSDGRTIWRIDAVTPLPPEGIAFPGTPLEPTSVVVTVQSKLDPRPVVELLGDPWVSHAFSSTLLP